MPAAAAGTLGARPGACDGRRAEGDAAVHALTARHRESQRSAASEPGLSNPEVAFRLTSLSARTLSPTLSHISVLHPSPSHSRQIATMSPYSYPILLPHTPT